MGAGRYPRGPESLRPLRDGARVPRIEAAEEGHDDGHETVIGFIGRLQLFAYAHHIGSTGEAWLSELSTDELRDMIVLDHHAVRGT